VPGKKGLAILLLFCAAFTAGSQEGADGFWGRIDGLINTAEELLAPPADNSDSAPRSFTILNETGFPMKEIYVRKANDASWGESIITQPLYNGQSVAVRLGALFDASSRYSIRMIDIDGDAYVKNGIRIRERSTVRMAIGDFEWNK